MKGRIKYLILASCVTVGLFTGCNNQSNYSRNEVNESFKDNSIEENKINHTKIEMNDEMKRELNIFISNFAEVRMSDFIVNEASDEELIIFGVSHCLWNYKMGNYEFTKDISRIKIPITKVNEVIETYFNKINVSNNVEEIAHIKAKAGSYYVEIGDEDPIYFAQIERLEDYGDYYVAYADIYSDNNSGLEELYSPMNIWSKDAKESVKLSEKVKVKFKNISDDDGDRYVLLEYKILKD